MSDNAVSKAVRACDSEFGRGKKSIGAPFCVFKDEGVRNVPLFLKIVIKKVRDFRNSYLEGRTLIVKKSRREYNGKIGVRYDIRLVIPWFNNGKQ